MTPSTFEPLTPRMKRFLQYQSTFAKNSTLSTYKISLRRFSRFLHHQNKSLLLLSSEDVVDFMLDPDFKKLAPYTQLNYLLCIRLYLAWEAEHKNFNPDILKSFDRSKLPKIPEYLPKPLSSENDLLLQQRLQVSNSPYAPIFLLLRHTGLRISELINLPWNPIFLNNNNEPFLKVPLGKMNNERLLPLHHDTLNIIQKIKSAYPIALNRCDKNRLIGLKGNVANVRRHLDYHFNKFVHDIFDQNKPVTFHRLRHTYATTLLSAGVSIVSIMKLLGHKRIEMSLRYAKITPTHLKIEYFKAIAVIENQNALHDPTSKSPLHFHPSQIIDLLKAYISHSALFSAAKKKNTLRSLTRIKSTFLSTQFSRPFKITTLYTRINPCSD